MPHKTQWTYIAHLNYYSYLTNCVSNHSSSISNVDGIVNFILTIKALISHGQKRKQMNQHMIFCKLLKSLPLVFTKYGHMWRLRPKFKHVETSVWAIDLFKPLVLLVGHEQNSADSDQTPHHRVSDLSLHCLLTECSIKIWGKAKNTIQHL